MQVRNLVDDHGDSKRPMRRQYTVSKISLRTRLVFGVPTHARFFFFVVCLPPVEIFCKLWKGRRKNFCRNSRFTETFIFIILVIHKLSSFLSPLRTWSKGSSYLNSLLRRFLVLYLLGSFVAFLRNGCQPKDIKCLFTSRDD